MGKLFEIPDDIVKRFFEIVAIRGKYQIEYDPIERKYFYFEGQRKNIINHV